MGGPGDDGVTLLTSGTFYGGPGADFVGQMGGGTFYGGDGADKTLGALDAGTFYGEAGDDYVPAQTGGVFLGGEGSEIVSNLRAQGLFCGGAGIDYVDILSAFDPTPGEPSPERGGTFFGEEETDQVGLFLPGGTFFQDGACPVAYVRPPARP